uniref:Uncharacterized protein n=1 Tax=Rhizophora mucronata TaxID=61149 RepID=A0A2P2PSB2_RHIMU
MKISQVVKTKEYPYFMIHFGDYISKTYHFSNEHAQ